MIERIFKQSKVMETETIQKNEVSPKDLNARSRGIFLFYGMLLFALCTVNTVFSQPFTVFQNGNFVRNCDNALQAVYESAQ